MKGGRKVRGASNEDEKKDTERGASRHADQYRQSGVDVLESRAMERGRRAGRASDRDEFENIGKRASLDVN
jgi:hypothetical protein